MNDFQLCLYMQYINGLKHCYFSIYKKHLPHPTQWGLSACLWLNYIKSFTPCQNTEKSLFFVKKGGILNRFLLLF